MVDVAQPPAPPPRRRRHGRFALSATLSALAILLIALAATVTFLLGESGLPFLVARIVAQSGGRLSVEEPTGSAMSSMRFKRLVWRGSDTTVEADDVVIDWNPGALWSLQVSIRGLGAQRVSISLKPSTGGTSPPQSLALPLNVRIDRIGVARLEWQTGPRRGLITGLEFGYSGGAVEHRVDGLHLVSDIGTLEGDAQLSASAPLSLRGAVAVDGDGPLKGARLDAQIKGTLSAVTLDVSGRWQDALLNARVALTPFAGAGLDYANLGLSEVDAAKFAAGLPHTRSRVEVTLHPNASAITGNFVARNDDVGPLDSGRLPIASLSARYSYENSQLSLADADLAFAGKGHATGNGSLSLATPALQSRWSLSLRDVDLAAVHSRLLRTQVAGTLTADIDNARQILAGDLRDANVSASFAATIAQRKLTVSRFTAHAGGGSITGTADVGLDGASEFRADVTIAQFDPAHLGAFPRGAIGGQLVATGKLRPTWNATGELTLAAGSRLLDVPVSGMFQGSIAADRVRDANVQLTAGSATLTARGDAGAPGDAFTFAINAPRLGDLNAWAPAAIARPLAGSVNANGTLRIEPGGIGGDIEAHGSAIALGSEYTAQAFGLSAKIAPGGSTAAPIPLIGRALSVALHADALHTPERNIKTLSASVDGTLAHHTATITAHDENIDLRATFDGGAADLGTAGRRWVGTVVALDNSGTVPLHLMGPASIEVSAAHQRLSNAAIAIAGGRISIAEFARDEARITTRGDFTGVPLASAAALAGRPLPIASTLALGGSWSVAASPRLTGSFSIQRESGDLFGVESLEPDNTRFGFGITTWELTGTFQNDALDARTTYRSVRAGNGEGTLHIGSVSGAVQGTIAKSAPVAATLNADLSSLQALQPWVGTAAIVSGHVQVALAVGGTVGAPVVNGTLAGDNLRVDAAPYGINVSEGTVRAHVVNGNVAIDQISFAGGDGRFTATGVVDAGTGKNGAPSTHVEWHATKFRVVNRPDLRLVVGGEGTIAIANRRVSINGTVQIEQGHVEYERAAPGQLGPDVVIVGRPRVTDRNTGFGDLPLALDVDVDLGNDLTFIGEGLETGLTGRVKVTTTSNGALRGRGTIQAVRGTYFAFGQKLTIDHGRMIFDGALDDPALDVVALRKNLGVEAGVELSGTVKVPRVRITSNPPVPENEALSWLLTGQGLSSGSHNDYAAISAASAALLARGGKPITTQLAQSIGLDDISVQSSNRVSSTTTGTSGIANQVVVFGKRITDQLTLGYEQGVNLASGAVRLEYALTRTFTLRLEAGVTSSLGVYYRRSFE